MALCYYSMHVSKLTPYNLWIFLPKGYHYGNHYNWS